MFTVLKHHGGIAPGSRKVRAGSLTTGEREENSRGLSSGESCRTLADRLGRAVSTISCEVDNSGRKDDGVSTSDEAAATDRGRPGPRVLALHASPPRQRRRGHAGASPRQ
ncbi:helix-turn-helix domain-containing protein [Streptomyces sp. NPDC003016]